MVQALLSALSSRRAGVLYRAGREQRKMRDFAPSLAILVVVFVFGINPRLAQRRGAFSTYL
jgi:hypothetical protein